eukprot:scaffold7203_cov416-Prasinococcus_capsulatus_cf.AAC.14
MPGVAGAGWRKSKHHWQAKLMLHVDVFKCAGRAYKCGSNGYHCYVPPPDDANVRLMLDVSAAFEEGMERSPQIAYTRPRTVARVIEREPELEHYLTWRRADLIRVEEGLKAFKAATAESVDAIVVEEAKAKMVEQMVSAEMILILDWSMGGNQSSFELPVMTPYRSGSLSLIQMPPAPAHF